MNPASRRRAVEEVIEKLGVSERQACKTLGQNRNTQRYELKMPQKDQLLIEAIREQASKHKHRRYGYRRISEILCILGWIVNHKQCILVLMGATEDGKKELIAIAEGYRESTQSWRELLLDVKNHGLSQVPKLATGDGVLGFWAALEEVFPTTRQQRCWIHKTANVLNRMPKSLQPKAKAMLHDIWMAETRQKANEAFDLFIESFEAKYPKAVECLVNDRDVLLTFYDFPGEARWRRGRNLASEAG